jgi:hypothetical protein
MRSHRLIPVLALAAGLTVPAALAAAPSANASALATSCRVEMYDLDSNSVDEADGTDELRIEVGSNLYPASYFGMGTGDDGDPADFGNPSTTVGNTGSVVFSLREVTPPVVRAGYNLGSITAQGSTCATLATGQTAIISKTITGTDETYYSYYFRLVMTGL